MRTITGVPFRPMRFDVNGLSFSRDSRDFGNVIRWTVGVFDRSLERSYRLRREFLNNTPRAEVARWLRVARREARRRFMEHYG